MEPARYDSLPEALRAFKIPEGNHAMLQRITQKIPIAYYTVTTGYIRAERADGGPALWMHSGWTDGFVSAEEATRASGGTKVEPYHLRKNLYLVLHPVTGPDRSDDARTTGEADHGTCESCHQAKAANGECWC